MTDRVAVVTMEMQRGICGDLASLTALADAVTGSGVSEAAGRLVAGARAAGLAVVHCTFSLPADRSGLDLSSPLLAPARTDPDYLRTGTPACDLLPGIGAHEGDLRADRHHGVSPFGGTDLPDRLRAIGITELVVCGVSLNVGIPGLVIEAVNHGFAVTVAEDAVVGLPEEYGRSVLRHTLRYLASIVSVNDLVEGWTAA